MTSPKNQKKPVKWKRVLLIAAIALLAGYTGWRLAYNWWYTQPITLETACKLEHLDDCQQIKFDILTKPLRTTSSGNPYYPYEGHYQLITREDEAYDMIMDYIHNHTFHRTLTGKQHPDYQRGDLMEITIEFYDNTGEEDDLGNRIEDIWLFRHCADNNCFSYLHLELPHDPCPRGTSSELGEPLLAIMEQITAEKGWIDYKPNRR